MIPWTEIISLIMGALSGASSLKQLISKHPSVIGRVRELYTVALKRWSPNKTIRKLWEDKFPTADELTSYFSSGQPLDSEVNSLLNVWSDLLKADEVCRAFLLDAEISVCINLLSDVSKNITEVLSAIKAPYNTLYYASSALRSYFSDIIPGLHIERQETDSLYSWLNRPSDSQETQDKRITFLLADAGLGKTVILHDLLVRLETEGVPVLGIKSDIIFDSSDCTIDKALNLGTRAASVINEIAMDQKVVVLIDQIDALSATLSSDRSPLASINSFINEITSYHNVRVIVSCRQYDFDYESAFTRYKPCNTVKVDILTKNNVVDVLQAVNIEESQIDDTVKTFLRSPLNLFLYCRLVDRTQVNIKPTLQDLYSSLWKEIIIDKACDDTRTIVDCLDQITAEMNRRQVLTLNACIFHSETARQRAYLISNDFLKDVGDGRIQFIHQTLFEYTFARLFVERKRSLDSLLTNKHQGLFLRPQLKQILEYQRNVDSQTYILNIREILFSKDESGKARYRFHLKQLVVTSIAYHPHLIEAEKPIVKQLFQDIQLCPVILSAICTRDGIELLWEYIRDNGGIGVVDNSYIKSYLNATFNIGVLNPKMATTYLVRASSIAEDVNFREQFIRTVTSLPITKESASLLTDLIKISDANHENFEMAVVLDKLINYEPEFVKKYLAGHLKEYIKQNTAKWTLDVPRSYQNILRHFRENNPDLFLSLGLHLLDIIIDSSEEYKGDEIRSFAILDLFNRSSYSHHFDDWLLNELIEVVETEVDNDSGEINRVLDELANSKITVKHIIALAGWNRAISRYRDNVYHYLINNLGRKFHSSYLEYQQQIIWKSVLLYFTPEEQSTIIKKINIIEPEWEKIYLKGEGHSPVTMVGYTKAQYWSLVPEAILKEHPKEYQEYKALCRKYKHIKVQEPSHVETMVGWPSVSVNKVLKMSKANLIKLALTHDKDSYLNWNRPTRHGNAKEFALRAEGEPDFMCDVYNAMLDEDTSLSYFVAVGIDGLRKGGCQENKIIGLLEKIIACFPDDVNSIEPTISFRIIQSTDFYINSNTVPPKCLFDFLIKVALTAKEEDKPEKTPVDVNDGINQLRGNAVNHLVQLYYCQEYVDELLRVLEVVARNGSVATRCVLTFRLALLLHVDRQKTLKLFLTAVKRDYDVSLLRMPLHDLNPLVYLAKTNFDDLREYFEECIKRPESHETTVVILFAAWLRNSSGAEDLTIRMADSSISAKYYLIRYIANEYNPAFHDKNLKVLFRYISLDDRELGVAYDEVAKNFNKWLRSDVKTYLEKYSESSAARYAAHEMTKYLKTESRQNPEDCLRWLNGIYKMKKELIDKYQLSEYIQILIEAYNGICKYDLQNPELEAAMDMFDEFLMANIDDRPLGQYLKEIS